ncbi:GntR family transcriptional regulator [Reyranella sp.]|uniref:GntR family transcriptional regulator n=1 Tax=Reyranella sp. TaxID=1929291 RepID=UPI003BA96B7A
MTFDPALFQRSRAPIYLQIAKLLRQRIEQGEWPVGSRMPSLEDLMATYGVARATLREAVAQLEREGVIRRSRGSGTFVTKDLSAQRWFKLPTDWDGMLESLADLRVRLLPIAATEGGPPLPELDFIEGVPAERYRYLRRVHYRQDLAYCLIDVHLERAIFDRDPEAFTTAPVLTRLASLDGLEIAAARQVVRIAVSDADTASYLDIGVGDPVAEVRRAVTDVAGRIVYYAHIRYPAELIEIDIDLMRNRSAGKEKTIMTPAPGRTREGKHNGRRRTVASPR